ncbi:hypothetical protein NDN08_006018 [Rhodosorus marinus]|uniref:Uncharacterized protein n=1 Tax=Rhodosorus marinus TaxID=101924 RepID=A0AAV8UMC5_9RHOD|nr:hypothetical protein NDN08_006018 [Rhodosorus marinus]
MALSLSGEKRVGSSSTLSDGSSQDCFGTRAHELLTDADVVDFLTAVDAQVRHQRRWLDATQQRRLEALHLQAATDECMELSDVVEYLEEQNGKLVSNLSSGSRSDLSR